MITDKQTFQGSVGQIGFFSKGSGKVLWCIVISKSVWLWRETDDGGEEISAGSDCTSL